MRMAKGLPIKHPVICRLSIADRVTAYQTQSCRDAVSSRPSQTHEMSDEDDDAVFAADVDIENAETEDDGYITEQDNPGPSELSNSRLDEAYSQRNWIYDPLRPLNS